MSPSATLRPFQGKHPQIDPTAYVDPMATVIGPAEIAADCSIWPMVSVRCDVHAIRIGARSNIQDNSCLHVTGPAEPWPEGHPLIIGEDVTVGHGVILHGCTIRDRCLVGMGAIVLDGAVLEEEVFLAAGSLVSPGKILEGGYLWRGSPAQKARPLTDAERAWLRISADNYVRLKNEYLAG